MYLDMFPVRRAGGASTRRSLAASGLSGPMTAARYLRLRREAAGVTLGNVAARLRIIAMRTPPRVHPAGVRPSRFDDALGLVKLLESPGARARHRVTVEAIASIVPLDVDTYFQLANDPADRHPRTCGTCGAAAGTDDRCNGRNAFCQHPGRR